MSNVTWYSVGNTTSTMSTSTWSNTLATTCTTNANVICPSQHPQPQVIPYPYIPDHIKLEVGKDRHISFPDGTLIDFKIDGSFEIHDENAKVIYRANRSHDFNPFLNASDKLEEFIRFCGTIGVKQGDMLGIPIKNFVQWLVIEAARADGQSDVPLELPDLTKPRCRSCGRFMSPQLKADGIEFCRAACLETRLNRRKHNGYQATTTKQVKGKATSSTVNESDTGR